MMDLCISPILPREKYADKKRSGREDRRILNKYLVPQLRHVRAKDVMRAQIRVILDEIAKDAPNMANRVLASVRKMYNWAIGQDLVEHNPCFKVPAPSKERRRDRVLSNEELKKVWDALDNDKSSVIAHSKCACSSPSGAAKYCRCGGPTST